MKTATSPSVPWVEQGATLPVNVKVQTSSSTNAVTDLPASSFRSTSPVRSKRIQRAALAAAALILSGVALLFICKRLSSSLTEASLAHRKLAGHEDQESSFDEELDEILTQCLELEAEHGEPPPETEWVEPAAKKARLVAFLQEAASSYESAGRRASLYQEGFSEASSRTYRSELQWPSAAHSSGLQITEEVLTHENVSLPGLDINPDLDPNAFLEQIPHLEEKGEEEAGEPAATAVLHRTTYREQPSTSSTLFEDNSFRQTPGTHQGGPEEHPFFRLPTILPGAIRRELRLMRSYPEGISGQTFFPMLEKMRELFLLPSLGPKEVEELMCVAESLVCFILNHPSSGLSPPFAPSHIARHLGIHFFLLDYLLCARQLIGPHMIPDEWWNAITKEVSTDFPIMKPIAGATPRRRYNYALVKRLIPAVNLLKSGVRPPAKEIVRLKRMLLCSPHSDSRFKAPRWDLWREDEQEYAQTHEDFSVDSEDE